MSNGQLKRERVITVSQGSKGNKRSVLKSFSAAWSAWNSVQSSGVFNAASRGIEALMGRFWCNRRHDVAVLCSVASHERQLELASCFAPSIVVSEVRSLKRKS